VSSLAGSALVESSNVNCRIFYSQQGHCADVMPVRAPEPGWCAVHSTPSRLCQCPVDGLRPLGIGCEGL